MTPPQSRQPIFNVPPVVIALIALMAAIQGARAALLDRVDAAVLARFAFVPGRFTYEWNPARVLAPWANIHLDQTAARQSAMVARFFLGDGSAQPWTALTYALLHGGWMHLGLNSIWLLAFGTPLARRIGPLRFLVFVTAAAVVGAAAHFAVDPVSLQPLIGASAAVSACMAASLRFMFQPARRVHLVGDLAQPRSAERAPRVALLAMLTDRRALAFLLVWFLTNLVTGIAAVPFGFSDQPIAWQAHIGGFLMGLLIFPLFDRMVALPRPEQPDFTPA